MRLFRDESIAPLIFACLPDQDAMRMVTAVIFVERYTHHARIQYERIQEFFRVPVGSPDWFDRLDQAACDAHMYFTCWQQVSTMMAAVVRASSKAPQLKPLGVLYGRLHGRLKAYNEARDALEHLDERIPGGRRVEDLVDRSDLGAFMPDGSSFSFGGLSWNIGESSVLELESTVRELLLTLESSLRSVRRAEGSPAQK
jgi:hypothetical protein